MIHSHLSRTTTRRELTWQLRKPTKITLTRERRRRMYFDIVSIPTIPLRDFLRNYNSFFINAVIHLQ